MEKKHLEIFEPQSREELMNLSEVFPTLNENQLAAVLATEGYVCNIAGAGSGKTKVLTTRYVYLVEELGIAPSSILCVTFSNRAANEMKSRIQKVLKTEPINDLICTFHGFCVKILRDDIGRIGYPKNFTIMDEEDQKSVLKEAFLNIGITTKGLPISQALKSVRQFKSSDEYVSQFILSTAPIQDEQFHGLPGMIILEYLRIQKKNFSLDFEDLLAFAAHILNCHPEVLEKWQDRLQYIMVDETQDNSIQQWKFVELLAAKHKNLFVVGDPDQAVYEWRGAKPEELVDFDRTHADCKTVVLDQNYRSTKQILLVANSLIARNNERIVKQMFTANPAPSKVIHYHGRSETDESQWVIQKIKARLQTSSPPPSIAILYRQNSLSRPFEQALIEARIPYVIYGGTRFFERREIKDCVAYLRLIATGDDLSFRRIINVPSRQLGKVFMSKLERTAREDASSMLDALRNHGQEKDIKKDSAIEFLRMIEQLKEESKSMSISDLIQRLLDRSGLLQVLRFDPDQDRIDNINELIQYIKNYETSNQNEEGSFGLDQFLQNISLYTNLDVKKDEYHVKLMTIHQSKGMEFETVFVVGLSEGILPNHRAIREGRFRALEEERRLTYVAITRAEKELFLTESEGFYHEVGFKTPSRFFYEIEEGLVELEGIITQDVESRSKGFLKNVDVPFRVPNQMFSVGDRVVHHILGEGKVESAPAGTNPNYSVILSDGRRRNVDGQFNKLVKLEEVQDSETESQEASI